MRELYTNANVLLISKQGAAIDAIAQALKKEGISPPAVAATIHEAKCVLIDMDIALLLIDMPICGEDGAQFAIDLVRSRALSFGVIMLLKAEDYDKHLYQAERLGIVTLRKPVDLHLLLQTVRLLLSFQARIRKLESQADKLQQKLEDDRLVNRAKLLLIEQLKMREQDAHHYIEKKAMDKCVRRTKIAKEIIRMYEPKG